MVKILSKNLDLEKVVTSVKETVIKNDFCVFDREVGRDEVLKNKSFFLYSENGTMEPTSNGTQYKKEFILMFISREGAIIDDFEQVNLIERLRRCGLLFSRMTEEEGRLLDTEESVLAVTFYFNRIIKVCHDED